MKIIPFTEEHEKLLFQIPLFQDLPTNVKESLCVTRPAPPIHHLFVTGGEEFLES